MTGRAVGCRPGRTARRTSVAFVVGVCVLMLMASVGIRAERLPIRSYSTSDGLAHDRVNRIVPDSRGFLWLCTAAGLSRFDGYTFLNLGSEHGLPSATVNDLLETRAGKYWIATDEGLVRFNPAGRPQNVLLQERDRDAALAMFAVVLPADQDRRARAITIVREGLDGTIWVGTRRGLYRLDGSDGQHVLRAVDIALPGVFPGQREIVDLLEDSRGSIWVVTPVGLHRRWADGSTAAYPLPPLNDLSDVFEDRSGGLWVASRTDGIARLAVDAGRTPPVIEFTLSVPDGLPSPWVTHMFETSDGRFWVGTAGGLAELLPVPDRHGRRFRSYTVRNGLTHGYLSAIAEDAGGNLWLSTTNAGVMKLARDGFITYGRQDGIETVGAVFTDAVGNLCVRGQVLSGALERFYRGSTLAWLKKNPEVVHLRMGCMNGDGITWFHPRAPVNLGWATRAVTLQARNGAWWLGTGEGLFRYAPSVRFAALDKATPVRGYTMVDGLASNQVLSLFEDSRGDVWVSTIARETNGLARWDHESGLLRNLAESSGLPPLVSEAPRSFGEDRSGAVWIGFSGSIARYSAGQFRLFGNAEGVPAGNINDIHVDRSQRLWLASSQSGLIRVDNPESARPMFVRYGADRLSSHDLETIAEDAAGHLYVGGGHGIDRVDPQTGRVKHFTAADGLAQGIVTSGHRDRDGALWFGLTTGLTRMIPAPDRPSPAPRAWITGLRVSGIPHLVSARGEQHLSLATLGSEQNQMQIDFVGIGFRTGEVMRYQYRLEGAGSDWSPLTEQRSVTYAALSPRRYVFAVRSVNSDGVVSAEPASISFQILPPFWLRWWFMALAVSVTAVLVHEFYRRRAARLLEMANLRTRIAADLHDDIGANLTRIVSLSEVAQREDGVNTAGSALALPLVSIARIARESVASMGDIVWAVNPARDSVGDLTRRMRRHAEDLFRLPGTALSFIAPADEHVKLGAEVRRDVLLVFKEAVNNVARHSECTRVEIEFAVQGPRLSLVIADNGVGFDPSVENVGQGLVSLRRRAKRMRGTVDIVSGHQQGTTVRLVVGR